MLQNCTISSTSNNNNNNNINNVLDQDKGQTTIDMHKHQQTCHDLNQNIQCGFGKNYHHHSSDDDGNSSDGKTIMVFDPLTTSIVEIKSKQNLNEFLDGHYTNSNNNNNNKSQPEVLTFMEPPIESTIISSTTANTNNVANILVTNSAENLRNFFKNSPGNGQRIKHNVNINELINNNTNSNGNGNGNTLMPQANTMMNSSNSSLSGSVDNGTYVSRYIDPNYQEARYKTEICLHYRERNSCPHGQRCLFAHGLEELRPYRGRHPKHKTEKCEAFHRDGYCNYGYRCSYIHSESPRTISYIKRINRRAQAIKRNRSTRFNRRSRRNEFQTYNHNIYQNHSNSNSIIINNNNNNQNDADEDYHDMEMSMDMDSEMDIHQQSNMLYIQDNTIELLSNADHIEDDGDCTVYRINPSFSKIWL